MPRPKTYSSSSIGWDVDISHHFADREETVSITWDDGFHFENDNAFLRVFHQCEPASVLNIVDKLIANHKHYDLIMGFDERVLRECENSVFLTESACSWLPRKSGAVDPLGNMRYADGTMHKNPVTMEYTGCKVEDKKFAVSFLTSSKMFSTGHKLRQEIYERLPESFGALEVWKHRSPPIVSDKRTVLEPYMFSIVPENSQQSGYYTEKIIDAFVAKTIPVYWGCPDIGKHYNLDGIVQFSSCEDMLCKLASLTPDYYTNHRYAIEENFKLALQGVHQWDLIEEHITRAIEKKHREGNKRVEDAHTDVVSEANVRTGPYRPLRRPLG